MTERKWTPGPWDISYDNDTGPNDDCFHEWMDVGPAKITGQYRGRDLANARLIAAAPDLYEALEFLLSCYRFGAVTSGKDRAIREAAVALAKANPERQQ
jgi:hypothetical protein